MSSDELDLIMRKKMLEYMSKLVEKKEEPDRASKVGAFFEKIKPLLTPEAYGYLLSINKSKPDIGLKVASILVYLAANGLIDLPIDKLTVEVVEKKLEGYTGKIYIKRGGELKELGDILKE